MRWSISFVLLALALAAPALAESGTSIGTLEIATVATAPALDPHDDLATWKAASPITLAWDVQHQRPASETTVARIALDGAFVYARFDVDQHEPLLQAQHTNNVGDGTDDEVWVDFWPSGSGGFYYQFAATSNGTHYQYSSENTGYQPTWEAYGATRVGGFAVTMKIPINVMRGGGPDWKVQFVRIVRSTGERQIWSYVPAQSNGDDVSFAGTLRGMRSAIGVRPQPRIGIYALAEAGSKASGLSTSRVGADLSIPITANASLFATLHPDFSNVEIDQATIAPTAFARFFSEVRPFFTQAGNYFDNFDCSVCPGINALYTPSIPTPRAGYALEGHQGRTAFAAFDAVGVGRIDTAQSFGYTSADNHVRYFMERIAADCTLPGTTNCPFGQSRVHDDTFANGLNYNDGKHIDTYFNYGSESGSLVADASQAQRYDGGAYLYDQNQAFAFSARKVGRYYNPADGLIQHPDIAGYGTFAAKIWTFSPRAKMNSVGVSALVDRYHNRFGQLDQSDTNVTFDALTRSRIDVSASFGSSYLLQDFQCAGNACTFAPTSQNGLGVLYHSGTVNSPGNFPNHGSSATPTSVTFNTGRFGLGRLDAWTRSATLTAGTRGTIALEADDTRQYLDGGGTNVQWLERLGYTYAATADSSFAVGIRRIVGTPPLIFAAAPVSCTTVSTSAQADGAEPCTGAWNLSFAYHRRLPHDELYVAYGDASRLSTTPSFILKLVHYFGAEKGT